MKEVFAPQLMSKDARDKLFDRSIIVLDTNVLLKMYRVSRPTSDEILKLLMTVADRLWLPYQVGWEFFRNRAGTRESLTSTHQEIINALESLKKQIEKHSRQRSHVAGNDEERDRFRSAIQRYVGYLQDEKRDLGEWSKKDPDSILQRILDLYDGRCATAPSVKWYAKRTREGKRRYAYLVPPGYADIPNGPDNVFGDYFLWKECMDHARRETRPFVIVTEDIKEDWRAKKNGPTPRPELLQEFHARTGQIVQILSLENLRRELATRLDDASERQAADAIRDEIIESEMTDRASQEIATDFAREIFRQLGVKTDLENWMKVQLDMSTMNYPRFQIADFYRGFGPPAQIDPRLLKDLMTHPSGTSEPGEDAAPDDDSDEDGSSDGS